MSGLSQIQADSQVSLFYARIINVGLVLYCQYETFCLKFAISGGKVG